MSNNNYNQDYIDKHSQHDDIDNEEENSHNEEENSHNDEDVLDEGNQEPKDKQPKSTIDNVSDENEIENTEKEVDITFDSITKEQMNTSGLDKKFFELVQNFSSGTDSINESDLQDDDLKWKEFVAQLDSQ